jgi:hypothetical protein
VAKARESAESISFHVGPILRVPGNISAESAQIRLELLGTAGDTFELTQTANGVSQTINGVLPWQTNFPDANYSLTIKLTAPNEFGLNLFRNEMKVVGIPVGKLTHAMSYSITGKKHAQAVFLQTQSL